MVVMILMTTSMSAQKIDNVYNEARVLTEKMVEELGLSSSQKEKTYQLNLAYMNGINSYSDLNSQGWKQRNTQLKSILTSSQWKRYKKSSYFYRPVSWSNNSYVYNIYSKYPSAKTSSSTKRNNKQVTNKTTGNKRPSENGKTWGQNNGTQNKTNVQPNGSYNKDNNKTNVQPNGSYSKDNNKTNVQPNGSYSKDNNKKNNGKSNVKNNGSGNRTFGNMR